MLLQYNASPTQEPILIQKEPKEAEAVILIATATEQDVVYSEVAIQTAGTAKTQETTVVTLETAIHHQTQTVEVAVRLITAEAATVLLPEVQVAADQKQLLLQAGAINCLFQFSIPKL